MTASIDAPAVTKRRPGRPRNDGLEPGSVETRYCEFEKYTETDPETGLERKGSGNWGMFRCGRPLDRRARGTRCTKHVKTKETSNFRDDRGERSIKAYHEVTSWRTQQAKILSDSIWKQRALLEAHGVLLRELAGTPGTSGTSGKGSDQMVLVDRQRLADVVGSAMAVQETVDVSIRLVSAIDEQILKALIRDFGRGAKAQELIEDILDSQFGTTAETRDGRWIDRRLTLLEETVDVAFGISAQDQRGPQWQRKFLDDGRLLVVRLLDQRFGTMPPRTGLQFKAEYQKYQRGPEWHLVHDRLGGVLAAIASGEPFDLGDRPLDP